MSQATQVHELLIARLDRRASIAEGDRAAIRALSIPTRDHPRHARLVREGDRPTSCGFIVDGYAMRSKTTAAGGRQIVALLIPGDLIDLQQIVLPRADHDIEALTHMRIGDIAGEELRALVFDRSEVCRSVWTEILIENALARELLLNNGRRDAIGRIAHQFCEFACRFGKHEGGRAGFDLPLSQEQLGDMTALTGVHVNRTLQQLRRMGVISQINRRVVIDDWDALARVAGFSSDYLHADADTGYTPPVRRVVGHLR